MSTYKMSKEGYSMDVSLKIIDKIYDELTYMHLYGGDVAKFIIITLVTALSFIYCSVMKNKSEIAADWVNQRCKPQNIAFAGWIVEPKDKSALDYTKENFDYCVQQVLISISSYYLDPYQFMINSITSIFDGINASIQDIREIANSVRNGITEVSEEVYNRLLNVLIPIQTIFSAIIDSFNKVEGVMTSSLYTLLGAYYSLQSVMGAILELVIKILIILAILIVALWIIPVTWPVATTMTTVFLGIAIPLAIIIYFMTEVLHVKASAIPSLRCFDKDTPFNLIDNSVKNIIDICPGDRLRDGSVVTAKMKVLASGLDMYELNGIIVSGSHIVKHCNKWLPVRSHPDSKQIDDYNESFLYCLNTSNKIIVLNSTIFTDWDEIYDNTLRTVLNHRGIGSLGNISKVLDYGFDGNTQIKLIDGTKLLKHVEIGDILENGGIVYGIVELDTDNLGMNSDNKIYHLLVSNKTIYINGKKYSDYNSIIDSVIQNGKILSNEYV